MVLFAPQVTHLIVNLCVLIRNFNKCLLKVLVLELESM